MKFQKQCRKNLRGSKSMLDEMEVHKKNMTRTLQEIEDLEASLDQVKLLHMVVENTLRSSCVHMLSRIRFLRKKLKKSPKNIWKPVTNFRFVTLQKSK